MYPHASIKIRPIKTADKKEKTANIRLTNKTNADVKISAKAYRKRWSVKWFSKDTFSWLFQFTQCPFVKCICSSWVDVYSSSDSLRHCRWYNSLRKPHHSMNVLILNTFDCCISIKVQFMITLSPVFVLFVFRVSSYILLLLLSHFFILSSNKCNATYAPHHIHRLQLPCAMFSDHFRQWHFYSTTQNAL